MRKRKRIGALMLAIILVLSSCIQVFAAEGITQAKVIAEFDFDEASVDGGVFDGGNAVANGNYALESHGDGQALKLNGNNQFLSVTAKDGSSLLTGLDEFSVSFQIKAQPSATNWAFYAAPNENTQIYLSEKYIGIIDSNGSINSERYNSNNIERPAGLSYGVGNERWYHVTVVFRVSDFILYVNGEEVDRENTIVDISDLLGSSSVIYIGKAPWTALGEYCTALIDNYKIYSGALTADEVAEEAIKYVDKTALQDAVDVAKKVKNENYTATSWDAFAAALTAAEETAAMEKVTQNQVDAVREDLEYYQRKLKVNADKTELQEIVSAVDDYDSAKYTKETWENAVKELEEAKAVLAEAEPNQSAVNVAARQLDERIGELVEIQTDEIKLPYVDVTEADWFYAPVHFNYAARTMTGMDGTHFGPYEFLSRAQFAAILHRIEGEPEVNTEKTFHDISGDEWYGQAVLWAAEKGIVSGYENGCYGPDDQITREQMAIMMFHYAEYLQEDMSETGDISTFNDVDQVSTYALEAMSWANGRGIITGKEYGTVLDPQGVTVRAEAAAVIERFMKQKDDTCLDLSKTVIALMDNYMPNAKATLYSGMTVTGITVNAKEAGTLTIGTASVKDIVYARRYLIDYVSDVKEYEVTAGENTIELQLELEEDETIVIGGDGSVGLYYLPEGENAGVISAAGDADTAQYAAYTTVESDCQPGTVYVTPNLDIKIAFDLTGKEIRIFETFDEDTAGFSVASGASVVPSVAPFSYSDRTLFENKVITKIGIPVKTVNAINANQALTVSVVDSATLKNAIKIYKLNLPVEEIGTSTSVGKYIFVDCSIPVEEGQTLAFGSKSGDITWSYYAQMNNDAYAFYVNVGSSSVSLDPAGNGIVFDIYATEGTSVDSQLDKLQKMEEQAIEDNKMENLIAVVEDKNMSIIADSISSYQGYNNNAATSNSTTGDNAVFYSSSNLPSVNDTWWMQAIQETNMNLLVNNAWSGSKVLDSHSSAGYKTRPVNLHDDTGANAGTNPDIITVFLGINDFDSNAPLGTYSEELYDKLIIENTDGTISYTEPVNVTEAYIIMMDKMIRMYDGVDIFCFTLLPNSVNTNYAYLEEYNANIRQIAEHYDAAIVDLYYDSGITSANFNSYMIDGLHPNPVGMDMITDTFVNSMMEVYVG